MVFAERMSKIAHLVAVPNTINGEGTSKLFVDRFVCQHGSPDPTISNRDPRLSRKF